MIVVEDHIEEINGKQYVPYDIVLRLISEHYINTVEDVSTQLSEAMTQYRQELKNLGLENDQDSA
jgi:hypothetical protein